MQQRVYDIAKDFNFNIAYGPFWDVGFPDFGKQVAKFEFLGHQLWSPFGVSASPMTFGSKHIAFLARMGYDVLTYRSVRSVEWQGWVESPHWVYADAKQSLKSTKLKAPLTGSLEPFSSQDVSTVNSFGIQSLAPSQWQRDFELTKSYLGEGQMLILALMTTPREGISEVDDFVAVAKLAAQTSADVLEINLACPNSGENCLIYEDLDLSVEIARRVRKAVGSKKILLKVGYYERQQDAVDLVKHVAGIVDGITGINTIGVAIQDSQSKQIFPGRGTGGLSGAAVRELAQIQARSIVDTKKKLGLDDFVVIGVGGVMQPIHVKEYLEIGVDIVQTATGAWVDPMLAQKVKEKGI